MRKLKLTCLEKGCRSESRTIKEIALEILKMYEKRVRNLLMWHWSMEWELELDATVKKYKEEIENAKS